MDITLTLPEHVTKGDLLEASGAIIEASTTFVDWDRLASPENPSAPASETSAVSTPGLVLLSLARQLSVT